MARPGLHNHPKFRRLVHLLREPVSHIRGYLECMWDVGYEAGNPLLGDEMDVRLATEYPGDSSKITEALANCGGQGRAGFIEQLPDGQYAIHDLLDNAPDYVRKRARRESERKNKDLRTNYPPNGGQWRPTPDCQDRSDRTPAPAPAPAPAPKEKATAAQSSPEPPQAAASGEHEPREDEAQCGTGARNWEDPNPSIVASPLVLSFDVVGTGAKLWGLNQSKIDQYRESFPGVNVLAECRRARQWLIDNPRKRKTPAGMPSFLHHWLSKAQNEGGSNGQGRYRPDARATGRGIPERLAL